MLQGGVLMSVAYDGNGPFRGLAPHANMTYMQRQRQRAAALASGGEKSFIGGGASMIGKALRSGVRSWHVHVAHCSQAQRIVFCVPPGHLSQIITIRSCLLHSF